MINPHGNDTLITLYHLFTTVYNCTFNKLFARVIVINQVDKQVKLVGERVNNISIDILAFKMDMEHDFSLFYDYIQTMEANVQDITDILKM